MDVLPDPDLVSIDTAATMLGISKVTAYRLARMGELPGAKKIGGYWRVSLVRYRREIHGDNGEAA
jgi:excisionase family DNA binding protein